MPNREQRRKQKKKQGRAGGPDRKPSVLGAPVKAPPFRPVRQPVPAGMAPIGRAIVQPSAFTMAGEQANRLLAQYNKMLIERFGYMDYRALSKKDTVDVRPILDTAGLEGWEAPQPRQTFEDRLYCIEDYYYAFVPCFEEGVYRVNDCRYIYWKIQDLDLERHRMLLWLQDYTAYRDGCGWQPGVCGTVGWRFADPEYEKSAAISEQRRMKCEVGHGDNPGDVPDYGTMYALLDPVKDLHWGADDQACWEVLVRSFAASAGKAMLKHSGKDNLDSLAYMFTTYTCKVNRILEEHRKAARASRRVSAAEHAAYVAEKEKVLAEQGPEAAKAIKERRVRTIGEITITSRTAPKRGRAKADYKKASWTTRAHMRTLRSGKKVYIRSHANRRKALADTGVPDTPKAAPLTLVIKDTETAMGGGYEKKKAQASGKPDA